MTDSEPQKGILSIGSITSFLAHLRSYKALKAHKHVPIHKNILASHTVRDSRRW
jgi:hypothetical protein